MCDSWRLDHTDELSTEQVAGVFARIGRLDIVRLSGGEPFLRRDLLDIAEAILRASRPSVIHITTNGSFPHRAESLVRSFSDPRCLRFMVSFDGLAEVHNANRGKAVTFAKARETLLRLRALGRTHGVRVWANHTVISQASMADHDGLRDALGQDVDVHSVLAYSDSAMYGADLQGGAAEHLIVPSGYPLHPALHRADAIAFVERELADLHRAGDWLVRFGKRYYLRGLLARLRGDKDPLPSPACVALRSHLRILPDGNVPVCQFNTQTVGNLASESMQRVWHGRRAGLSRKWVDACPGCWAECEVIPNAIFTGDILTGSLPRSAPSPVCMPAESPA